MTDPSALVDATGAPGPSPPGLWSTVAGQTSPDQPTPPRPIGPSLAPQFGAALDVERLRIATRVNDVVIRHLFAIGLDLHRTRATLPAIAQQRVDTVIQDLDAAINELRSVIFDLHTEPTRSGS